MNHKKNNKNKIKKTRKQPPTKRRSRPTKRGVWGSRPTKRGSRPIKKLKGGKVIGVGGYGCVFRPALNCIIDKPIEGDRLGLDNNDLISKLLLIEAANAEWNEGIKLKPQLTTIPNWEKYFILPLEKCYPQKLTEADMVDLQQCNTILPQVDEKKYFSTIPSQQGIKTSVNSNIKKFNIIQNLYGGHDIYNTLKNILSPEKALILKNTFTKLNISLISLLINGIIPLNKKNIFHRDIKPENIVYDEKNTRLIDWGLAVNNINDVKSFPSGIIVYNNPLTTILYYEIVIDFINSLYGIPNSISREWFERLIKLNKKNSNELTQDDLKHIDSVKTIMEKNLYNFLTKNSEIKEKLKYGKEFISSILQRCPELPEKYRNPKDGFYNLIVAQCYEVMIKYTSVMSNSQQMFFNVDKFNKEVYSKNVDIFGWMITYDILLNSYLQKDIASLFAKYLYSIEYAAKPYDPHFIAHEFFKLNSISIIPHSPSIKKSSRKISSIGKDWQAPTPHKSKFPKLKTLKASIKTLIDETIPRTAKDDDRRKHLEDLQDLADRIAWGDPYASPISDTLTSRDFDSAPR